MKRTMKRTLLAAALLLPLSACVTDDPTKGGFFGGVGGLSSGTYSKRIDERKTELENQQDQRIANQRALDRAQQEQSAVADQRRASEAKLQTLQNDLAGLRRRLAVAQGRESASKAKLASLSLEAEQLERDTKLAQADGFATPEERTQRLEQLRRSKEELERQVQFALKR